MNSVTTEASALYRPGPAWALGLSYVLACLAIFGWGGGLESLQASRWTLSGWSVGHALIYLAIVLLGYGWLWPKGSFTDGRALHPWRASGFGLAWGLGQGAWFYTLWVWSQALLGPPWLEALLAYGLIASWQALWHSLFWDRYVSPPHNLRAWNARKVLFCHSPNLLWGLLGLLILDAAVVFIGMQILSLWISALAMHFPAWNDGYRAPAGMQR